MNALKLTQLLATTVLVSIAGLYITDIVSAVLPADTHPWVIAMISSPLAEVLVILFSLTIWVLLVMLITPLAPIFFILVNSFLLLYHAFGESNIANLVWWIVLMMSILWSLVVAFIASISYGKLLNSFTDYADVNPLTLGELEDAYAVLAGSANDKYEAFFGFMFWIIPSLLTSIISGLHLFILLVSFLEIAWYWALGASVLASLTIVGLIILAINKYVPDQKKGKIHN